MDSSSFFQSLTIADAVMVFTVFVAPLFGGLVLWGLQIARERRNRKEWIFKTLMQTRAAKLSADHVQALNLIEIEFSKTKAKEKAVVEAWKEYFDHLGTHEPEEGSRPAFYAHRENLFVELLHKMGSALGFDFDKVTIRRQGYGTRYQELLELKQEALLNGLLDVLYLRKSLPIVVTEATSQPYAIQCPKCGFANPPSVGTCNQCKTLLPGQSKAVQQS